MNKTMEKEYKWRADEYLLGQALLWASSRIGSQSRTIHMQSQYFDTLDGLLRQQQGALRLRRENERSVCCLKLRNENTPDGMRAHEEYQCDAKTVQEGLHALPDKGAPRDLCEQALAAQLEMICNVDFRRCAVLLQEGDTVCELALDEGTLRHGGVPRRCARSSWNTLQAGSRPSTTSPPSWPTSSSSSPSRKASSQRAMKL